jgi:hypothetical protein
MRGSNSSHWQAIGLIPAVTFIVSSRLLCSGRPEDEEKWERLGVSSQNFQQVTRGISVSVPSFFFLPVYTPNLPFVKSKRSEYPSAYGRL